MRLCAIKASLFSLDEIAALSCRLLKAADEQAVEGMGSG